MSLVIWPKFLTFIAESVGGRAGVGRRRVQMVRKIEGRRPQLNRVSALESGRSGRKRRWSMESEAQVEFDAADVCSARSKQNGIQGIASRGNAAGSRRGATRTNETESTQAPPSRIKNYCTQRPHSQTRLRPFLPGGRDSNTLHSPKRTVRAVSVERRGMPLAKPKQTPTASAIISPTSKSRQPEKSCPNSSAMPRATAPTAAATMNHFRSCTAGRKAKTAYAAKCSSLSLIWSRSKARIGRESAGSREATTTMKIPTSQRALRSRLVRPDESTILLYRLPVLRPAETRSSDAIPLSSATAEELGLPIDGAGVSPQQSPR